jgi:Kef-type K+ transport system membrane component KefB
MSAPIPPLVVVLAAAVAAPLLGELTRRIGLSIVVIELALGVAIGPQGLAWAAVEGGVPFIATLGMAFLFFLAGLEIDFAAIRGEPLRRALGGWLAAFALALAAAHAGRSLGWLDAWVVIGIALATTALGVLVPMLRDSGQLEAPFGRYVMAAGVVGELGPILAMSILLSGRHSAGVQSLRVLGFLAIVLAVAWALVRGTAVPPFLRLLRRTLTQSSQLPVRGAVLVLVALALLAEDFGVDLALGALAAGMIVRLAAQDAETDLLHQKLDAVGFGFLVPVFFISSGMKLDVMAVFGSESGLLLTGALFAILLVIRLPLIALHRHVLSGRESTAVGLLSATTLSLIVALTRIAVANGSMRASEASPLVMAGALSVVLYPLLAAALLGQRAPGSSGAYRDHDGL